MKYKDVVIINKQKDLEEFFNPLRVILNFNREVPPIGKAYVKGGENCMLVDIETETDLKGLYPVVVFRPGKTYELSMCSKQVDADIKPIK